MALLLFRSPLGLTAHAADDTPPRRRACCAKSASLPVPATGRAAPGPRHTQDHRAEPAARIKQSSAASNQIACKRRVDKHDIKRFCRTRQILGRVSIGYAGMCCPERLEASPQSCCRRRVMLHHHDLTGAARQRLDTKRPGAGEEIKTARAGKIRRQPVEECLPHAIRCRAQALCHRYRQLASSPRATDDPNLSRIVPGRTAAGSTSGHHRPQP